MAIHLFEGCSSLLKHCFFPSAVCFLPELYHKVSKQYYGETTKVYASPDDNDNPWI